MKNIIYLDEGKLFSLSSQLFSGTTEYIIREESKSDEEKTEQKGPVASGRLLADAMRSGEKTIEKRVLHDFAYARFEDDLISSGRISQIDANTFDPKILSGSTKSFVKIKARAEFFDTRKITELFSSFNKLGAALSYSQSYGLTDDLRAAYDERISGAKSKSEAGKLKQEKLNAIEAVMKSVNPKLHQDEKFLESLAMVTEYGYAGHFEVIQSVSDYSYSSVLNREYFREPEDLMIRKYSRATSVDLVLVGMVTQAGSVEDGPDDEPVLPVDLPDGSSMRNAIINLSRHMGGIERTLTGKEKFEVVVDPIALYVLI